MPSEVGALITGDYRHIPKVENTFSTSLCHCEGINLAARGGFNLQIKKNRICQGVKKRQAIWVFCSPDCLIHSYCLPIPILISLIEKETLPCYKDIRMAKV